MTLFIKNTRLALAAALITLSSQAYSSNADLDKDDAGNPLSYSVLAGTHELSTDTANESWWRRTWNNCTQESKRERLTPSKLSKLMEERLEAMANKAEIKKSESTYFNGVDEPHKFYHFHSKKLGKKVVISNPVYIAEGVSPIEKCQLGNLSYAEVIEEIMNPEIVPENNKVILMPIVNQDGYFFNMFSRQHYTLLMIIETEGKSKAVHIDSMDPLNKWFACPLENKLPKNCSPLGYKYLGHQGRFNEECGYYVMSYIDLILKDVDLSRARTLEVRSNFSNNG